MSGAVMAFMYCDGGNDCPLEGHEACDGDAHYKNVATYRRYLRSEEGWTGTIAKDYCEECSKRRAAHSAYDGYGVQS